MARWLGIVIALTLCAGAVFPAGALEPPRLSVEDAMNAGRLSFVARIQALQEIERRPTHTVARATLVVLKCLYGQACRRQSTLQMTYTPETLREGALGVNFLLGREYLLLFKQPTGKPLAFGTDWSRNMDLAFVLKTPLQPLSALDPAADVITFENVWGGPPQRVERAQLEAVAARRARDLRR